MLNFSLLNNNMTRSNSKITAITCYRLIDFQNEEKAKSPRYWIAVQYLPDVNVSRDILVTGRVQRDSVARNTLQIDQSFHYFLQIANDSTNGSIRSRSCSVNMIWTNFLA